MLKFVSDLRHVGGILWVLWFCPPTQRTVYDIIIILLKVALNTIAHYLKKNYVLKSVSIATKVVSSNHENGEVYSIQHFVMQFLSVTCGRLVDFSGYSGFLHQYNSGYWNIVECGVKHHNSNLRQNTWSINSLNTKYPHNKNQIQWNNHGLQGRI